MVRGGRGWREGRLGSMKSLVCAAVKTHGFILGISSLVENSYYGPCPGGGDKEVEIGLTEA